MFAMKENKWAAVSDYLETLVAELGWLTWGLGCYNFERVQLLALE